VPVLYAYNKQRRDRRAALEVGFCVAPLYSMDGMGYGALMDSKSQHILKDIDPYVCLFERCDQDETLFKTQEEWLGHMQWQHTVAWTCQICGHEPATYDEPRKLEHHIRSEHPASFTEIQLPVVIQESASPAPDTFAVLTASLAAECQTDSQANIDHECPICQKKFNQRTSEEASSPDDGEGGVQNHVLYHLESVALLSLPIDDKTAGNSADSNFMQSRASGELQIEGDDRLLLQWLSSL